MVIDERKLIETVFAPLAAGAPGAFGLRDDAALLPVFDNEDHVVTVDTLVEGVHFRSHDPADTIGRKALRVNVSDLTAKGADPFAWFLSLALPATTPKGWVEDFAAGLAEDQARYGLDLYGGDTVVSPGVVIISVTMVGRCPAGTSVRRFDGQSGDLIYVSGTIGDGALGLLVDDTARMAGLKAADRRMLNRKYLLPDPPVKLAMVLRSYGRAAMDISDGLVNDLGLMCATSGIGARVEIDAIPLSGPARAALAAQDCGLPDLLAGGDDYQVLAAVPRDRASAFEEAARRVGVAVSRIGRFTAKSAGVGFFDGEGEAIDLPKSTFRHFG